MKRTALVVVVLVLSSFGAAEADPITYTFSGSFTTVQPGGFPLETFSGTLIADPLDLTGWTMTASVSSWAGTTVFAAQPVAPQFSTGATFPDLWPAGLHEFVAVTGVFSAVNFPHPVYLSLHFADAGGPPPATPDDFFTALEYGVFEMSFDFPAPWVNVDAQGSFAAPAGDPATLFLLGASLVGLAGFARRRR